MIKEYEGCIGPSPLAHTAVNLQDKPFHCSPVLIQPSGVSERKNPRFQFWSTQQSTC